MRPPPVAEEGSKGAAQNKELKECAPSAPRNDYILGWKNIIQNKEVKQMTSINNNQHIKSDNNIRLDSLLDYLANPTDERFRKEGNYENKLQ